MSHRKASEESSNVEGKKESGTAGKGFWPDTWDTKRSALSWMSCLGGHGIEVSEKYLLGLTYPVRVASLFKECQCIHKMIFVIG